MTITMRIFMNSYWSPLVMTYTNTPLSLLTHELEVRSCGSPGRHLFALIEESGLELFGTGSPVSFAVGLQSRQPKNQEVLENLLELTSAVTPFELIALVALAPELELSAARLSWGRPSDDTVSELLSHATFALRHTHAIDHGDRAQFVLRHASSRTRSAQRQSAVHNVKAERIMDDFDAEQPPVDFSRTVAERLSEAMAMNIITSDEAELLEMTRSGECSLRQWAKATGEPYDRLRMRRTRAEKSLRRYFDVKGDGQ
jgi:hypothetical protein